MSRTDHHGADSATVVTSSTTADIIQRAGRICQYRDVFVANLTVEGRRRRGRPVTLAGVHVEERRTRGTVAEPVISSVEGLADTARDNWGDYAPFPALIERVSRDAAASDILGRSLSVERSFVGDIASPLARAAPHDFGRFTSDQGVLDGLAAASGEDSDFHARFAVGDPTVSGIPDISLYIGQKIVGSMVFAADSVIIPLPAGADSVSVRYLPDPGFQHDEAIDAENRIAASIGLPARPMLIWRAYFGTNTFIIDGVQRTGRAGWRQVKLAGLGAGVLVARIVFAAHRKLPGPRPDPSASRRRRSWELSDPKTAAACADIRDLSGVHPHIAVAVHGTMASAVEMAALLRSRKDWPVVRYEHDTWLPIEANARELAEQLDRLEVTTAVLIGHSRGGLVLRHAAEIAQAKMPGLVVRSVTLGTPFGGTPYVGPAGTSLLGARALLGVLRLATGAIAVDAGTRLAGLLILGGLPRGIAAMDVGSDYLSGFAHRALTATTTIAGDIDPTGADDANTVGFLRGVAGTAFPGQENDLVVSTESARGNCGDTVTVASDHFSYLRQDAVHAVIDGALRTMVASRDAGTGSATPIDAGETLDW